MRVALVACGAKKLDRPAPASELYAGTLFAAARDYANSRCDAWFILSAKHGLVVPSTVLEPYDLTLARMSTRERDAWGACIVSELIRHFSGVVIRPVLLAGEHYRNSVKPGLIQIAAGHRLDCRTPWQRPEDPLVHLAIGLQVQWLRASVLGASSPLYPPSSAPPAPVSSSTQLELF